MDNTCKGEFVVGFAFSYNRMNVTLIEKDGRRFPWMKGRLNGIGGMVEQVETPQRAMAREFYEETGVLIPVSSWKYKGKFYGLDKERDLDYLIRVFVTFTDEIFNVTTKEAEKVSVVGVPTLYDHHLMPNLKWLIPLCLTDRAVEFDIREE